MDFFSFNTDVGDLIAKKHYSRAAKVLKSRIEKEGAKAQLRQQLADVLILDGKKAEAMPILESLADEYAREGFVAKAIAVFKKIQRLDPAKTLVDEKLARLFKERDEQTASRPGYRRPSGPYTAGLKDQTEATHPLVEPVQEFRSVPEPVPAPEPPPPSPAAEDSFIIEFGGQEVELSEPAMESQPAETEALDLLGEGPEEAPAQAPAAPAISGGLAKTPLFSDFNTEELIAVMKGLSLLTFEPGDIIVSEGEAGHSMFVVSTGVVKAFVRDAAGHAHPIRVMQDGDFFGEMALLTGRPRTATVNAATFCELLELDSETVRQITATYPRVNNVLRAFCEIRMRNPAENIIRRQGTDIRG